MIQPPRAPRTSPPRPESIPARILLFDLDGTLLLTGGAGVRALNRAFQDLYGLQEAGRGVPFAGRTDLGIIRDIVEWKLHRPLEEEDAAAICERYLHYLEGEVERSATYRVLPGVPALLTLLTSRPDCLVGLGTGNLEAGARIKLARADLNRYFTFGGFGSDAESRVEVLRCAVARGEARRAQSGADGPARVFVIGDTHLDVESGRALGARTVAVATGMESAEALERAGPDHLLADLTDPGTFLRILDE
jgi:phosphoglycolate phosphatase-like HAD superfamily hydrolase